MTRRPALACLSLLALSACAAPNGKYPSLAPRPIEQRSDAPPAETPVEAAPDPALDARLASFNADLASAASDFATAADRAKELVAAAAQAGVGSDPWLDAQTALAELDGDRARSAATLSQLDALAIERASKLQPPYPALTALDDAGQAQADSETATIAALQKLLPGS
jgi:hypothetical protein